MADGRHGRVRASGRGLRTTAACRDGRRGRAGERVGVRCQRTTVGGGAQGAVRLLPSVGESAERLRSGRRAGPTRRGIARAGLRRRPASARWLRTKLGARGGKTRLHGAAGDGGAGRRGSARAGASLAVVGALGVRLGAAHPGRQPRQRAAQHALGQAARRQGGAGDGRRARDRRGHRALDRKRGGARGLPRSARRRRPREQGGARPGRHACCSPM